MKIRVVEYSGSHYLCEPREFYIGRKRHIIKKIRRQYIQGVKDPTGNTRSVWLVKDHKGKNFSISYDCSEDSWAIKQLPERKI